MAVDKFFIGPYANNSGQITSVKPFLIPDNAFEQLTNAYVFRGRVRKRFGSKFLGDTDDQLLSRFRINIGVSVGGGAFGPFVVPGVVTAGRIGMAFSIGSEIFTVYQAGNPAAMYSSGGGNGTFDTTTGTVTIGASDAPVGTAVYYYPALPVMGLRTFEQTTISDEITIGFDTQFAYQYSNGWERLNAGGANALWSGSNSQFFWTTTYRGTNPQDRVMFTTNFNENEAQNMRYLSPALVWNRFFPIIASGSAVRMISAKILVSFQNHLVALNIWEKDGAAAAVHYPNRIRWSKFGDPLAADAWYDNIDGKGSGADASTTESIVSAQFVRNRLIIYFERSTYELAYTGNQIQPFVLQLLNTELGVESSFSVVPFDQEIIGIANVGVHSCDGSQVVRIDSAIPDTVFKIHNIDEGVERVYGIRDYYVETVYWTFPNVDSNADFPYPNRVLVYNYRTGTWAFNDDSITAFGYFQPVSGVLWSSTTVHWADPVLWGSGQIQPRARVIIAGNQEGYTFLIDPDTPSNAQSLQITNISAPSGTMTITAIDHNLRIEDYIRFSDVTGTGDMTSLNGEIVMINTVIDKDNFTFINLLEDNETPIVTSGIYSGGGTMGRVSRIAIKTKQFNFYANRGKNAQIQKIEFMVKRTEHGSIMANVYPSTYPQPNNVLDGAQALDTYPYTTIYPYEELAERIWHPVYFDVEGEVVQIELKFNDKHLARV